MSWSTFWSAASAVSGIGVLAVTAVYAWLTHRLAKVAETQSWESSRARLLVSIGANQGGQMFLLEIENVGSSPAQDVRIVIDRPLHQQLGQNRALTEAPFFQEGLRALPPHRAIKFALGVSFRWLNDDVDRSLHPSTFNVTATYKTLGRDVQEFFPIDIKQQFSLSAVDKDYLSEFGRTFPEKFERSLHDVKRSLDQLGQPESEPMPKRRAWADWFANGVERKRESDRY